MCSFYSKIIVKGQKSCLSAYKTHILLAMVLSHAIYQNEAENSRARSYLLALFVQVVNCHESVIYILAPLKYATVYGCSDATIVIGAVGKVLMW